jgi:hypothetical protein
MKLDLETLKHVKQGFDFQSDHSTQCNGYRMLCRLIEVREEKPETALQEYEYEMFFDSKPDELVQIHGWYPIATDRIRNPEKIDHYIETGLLRRIPKEVQS